MFANGRRFLKQEFLVIIDQEIRKIVIVCECKLLKMIFGHEQAILLSFHAISSFEASDFGLNLKNLQTSKFFMFLLENRAFAS